MDAPEACSRLSSGYILARNRALIAALSGGKHARTPLGASEASSRLSFGYIFARSRAVILALHVGVHAQTPSGASEASSRLSFGHILAGSCALASAPWLFSTPDRCIIRWTHLQTSFVGACGEPWPGLRRELDSEALGALPVPHGALPVGSWCTPCELLGRSLWALGARRGQN